MSTENLDSLTATDPSQKIPEALRWFRKWVGKKRFKRKGLVGIWWSVLVSLGNFWASGIEVGIVLCLSAAISTVWWYYWTLSSHALIVKILITVAVAFSIPWTWYVSLRSRDREALVNIMLDFGVLLKDNRIKKDAASYQYLVDKYHSRSCSPHDNPLATIRATCPCKEHNTQEINRRYRDHGLTAADWHCVIFAKRGTALANAGQFGWWLAYFHEFDRNKQPADRISRVFSTPVRFRQSPEGPSWDEDGDALDLDERFRLLTYLFINWAVGVDTMLHCFDPQDECNSDFFHEADYVIVYDPTQPDETQGDILFIAVPGNEKRCLQLEGKSLWIETFRAEFYNRLTEGRGSRKYDCILDATSYNASAVVKTLGLDRSNLRQRWPEIRAAIVMHVPDFPKQQLSRLEKRWREWFRP